LFDKLKAQILSDNPLLQEIEAALQPGQPEAFERELLLFAYQAYKIPCSLTVIDQTIEHYTALWGIRSLRRTTAAGRVLYALVSDRIPDQSLGEFHLRELSEKHSEIFIIPPEFKEPELEQIILTEQAGQPHIVSLPNISISSQPEIYDNLSDMWCVTKPCTTIPKVDIWPGWFGSDIHARRTAYEFIIKHVEGFRWLCAIHVSITKRLLSVINQEHPDFIYLASQQIHILPDTLRSGYVHRRHPGTKERDKIIAAIYHENPSLPNYLIAQKACERLGDPSITDEGVRNALRREGIKRQRPERTR
jgi:hypothetical protein